MRRLIVLTSLATALTLPPTAGRAQTTTDVAGVKFPNSLQVASTRLQINGAGVRYKVVFKVYAAS